MSAWGKGPGGASSFRSCDALLKRIENNDPTLIECIILPMKTFGDAEVETLSKIIKLGKNTKLQSLSASGHYVSPKALETFGQALVVPCNNNNNNITKIAIGNESMGDDGIDALFRKGIVQSLISSSMTLSSNDDNDTTTTTTTTPRQCKLEMIDLSWKGIGPKGIHILLESLQYFSNLHTLILTRNQDAFVNFLNGEHNNVNESIIAFPLTLKVLNVSECGMNSKTCQWLLSKLDTLQCNKNNNDDNDDNNNNNVITNLSLNLSNNPTIGPDAFTIPTNSTISLSFLSELHLANCSIGDDGMQQLIKDNHCKNLRVLDVSYNQITHQSIEYLAKEIMTFHETTIQKEKNGDTTNNTTIPLLSTLEEWNLTGNRLNDACIGTLTRAIQLFCNHDNDNTTTTTPRFPLSRLDMTHTHCGIQGVMDLLLQLSTLPTTIIQLQELIVFDNQLGKNNGFVTLANALRERQIEGGRQQQAHHSSLKLLDIGGNGASESDVVTLLESLLLLESSSSTVSLLFPKNNQSSLQTLVIGGNVKGPSVVIEKICQEIKMVHPQLDILRDKPNKQQQQQQLPPQFR